MQRNLKFGLVALAVSFLGAVACNSFPFVGPANAPVACPVNCGGGMCCPFEYECARDGACRFVGTPPAGEM